MSLTDIGRLLMIGGVTIAAIGALVVVAGRAGLGRLPGDLSFGTDGVRVYIPIATCALISIVATVVLNLFARR